MLQQSNGHIQALCFKGIYKLSRSYMNQCNGIEMAHFLSRICKCFFYTNAPHMSFTDFVVFPSGHGRSVTDFWGWDAHEARLRCPDDVSGDIGGCSARRALKPKFD